MACQGEKGETQAQNHVPCPGQESRWDRLGGSPRICVEKPLERSRVPELPRGQVTASWPLSSQWGWCLFVKSLYLSLSSGLKNRSLLLHQKVDWFGPTLLRAERGCCARVPGHIPGKACVPSHCTAGSHGHGGGKGQAARMGLWAFPYLQDGRAGTVPLILVPSAEPRAPGL